MSLINRLVPSSLCVGLEPGQITVVERKGYALVGASAYRQALVNEDGNWQAPLAALREYFQQAESAIQGLPMSVVLSSKWCRMMMVPWSDALLETDATQRFLQLQYTALYGDAAHDWVITSDDAPYGQPRLACAIDQALLEAVRQLALDTMHPCRFLEPVVPLALRGFKFGQSSRFKAFALVEAGRISLVSSHKGRINALHAQSVEKDWETELMMAWQRWTLREPGVANIEEVGIIDLTGSADKKALTDMFKPVNLPLHGLSPHFSFAACSLEA